MKLDTTCVDYTWPKWVIVQTWWHIVWAYKLKISCHYSYVLCICMYMFIVICMHCFIQFLLKRLPLNNVLDLIGEMRGKKWRGRAVDMWCTPKALTIGTMHEVRRMNMVLLHKRWFPSSNWRYLRIPKDPWGYQRLELCSVSRSLCAETPFNSPGEGVCLFHQQFGISGKPGMWQGAPGAPWRGSGMIPAMFFWVIAKLGNHVPPL